ncbi:MAG: DotI/IcmL/TraM family protein [Alphaproteobacteria bacterium]|nr:DotI/IcmL/TraM family protein [Alphaproteobacteria bacterium]
MTFSEEFDRNQKRNAYYRDGYRNIIWIANIQVALILVLSGLLMFYVSTDERVDRYFAESFEGRLMQLSSLNSPNMEKIAVTDWAVQAAAQIMTFGFNDVERRFSLSTPFFTPQGWVSFKKALISSRVIEQMHKKQLIFTSIPSGTPVLLKEGLVVDKYTWRFNIPLMITYRAGGKSSAIKKKVIVVVEKVPTSSNPAGLGISEWYIY